MTNVDTLRERFEQHAIDPGDFGHREHVAAAWAMLDRYPFLEATQRYADTIRRLAERAGALEKFNLTITLAFMGLIAERRAATGDVGWTAFIAANADLLERDVLGRWYSPERLASPLARRQFVLPDRASNA